jgi:MOSC domain-containing protein YiiM
MPGYLVSILVKTFHGGAMKAQPQAVLEPGRGLVGNADQGGRRQVTLMSVERWSELMREIGASLPPDARRANLVVADVDLEASRGKLLTVGPCLLRIGGETRPCEQMEEAAAGLQAAMRARWGGGAFAEVLRGGPISVGDPVDWTAEPV